MPVRFMFALLVLVLVSACSVGEVDGPGTPDAAPSVNSMTFESMIRPLVMPKCTNCHGAGQQPILTSFATLSAGDPKFLRKPGNTNILVTKDNGTGQHPNGVNYFTAAEKMTVQMWIDNLQ